MSRKSATAATAETTAATESATVRRRHVEFAAAIRRSGPLAESLRVAEVRL
jgi:hypothetical protein